MDSDHVTVTSKQPEEEGEDIIEVIEEDQHYQILSIFIENTNPGTNI